MALACIAVTAGVSSLVVGRAASLPVSSQGIRDYRTCVLTATPNTTTVVRDSWVNQSSPTQNNGTTSAMDVQSSGVANRRTYVFFDLTKCSPSIPAGATVQLSTLRTFVTVIPGVCRTQDIFPATGIWGETTITWNNQPFGTALNNPPSAQATGTMTVGAAPCQNTATNVYVTGWDVTTDVQSFTSGSSTNNGWMIRDDVEGSATARRASYATKNLNNVARAPQLVVTYVV